MTRVDLESIDTLRASRLGRRCARPSTTRMDGPGSSNSFARVERRRNESQGAVSNRRSVVRALRGGTRTDFSAQRRLTPEGRRCGRQWIVLCLDGSATWGGFFMGFGLVISAYFAFSAILAWGLGNLSGSAGRRLWLNRVELRSASGSHARIVVGLHWRPRRLCSPAVAAALLGWAAFKAGSAGTLH